MKIYNSITEIFGNTPLLRINKITDGAAGNVYAKLEFYNPTSSVKDRLGVAMIDAAEQVASSSLAEQLLRQHLETQELPWQWLLLLVVIRQS